MVYRAPALCTCRLVALHNKCQHPGTHCRPHCKSRKMASTDEYQVNKSPNRLDSTKKFLYDSETGACLGRTAGSWGKFCAPHTVDFLHCFSPKLINVFCQNASFCKTWVLTLGIYRLLFCSVTKASSDTYVRLIIHILASKSGTATFLVWSNLHVGQVRLT